jgi:hypothetical protein
MRGDVSSSPTPEAVGWDREYLKASSARSVSLRSCRKNSSRPTLAMAVLAFSRFGIFLLFSPVCSASPLQILRTSQNVNIKVFTHTHHTNRATESCTHATSTILTITPHTSHLNSNSTIIQQQVRCATCIICACRVLAAIHTHTPTNRQKLYPSKATHLLLDFCARVMIGCE